MRRWNGWGDSATDYPLSSSALAFLEDRLGAATPGAETALEDCLARVPASRLAGEPDLLTDAEPRLRRAHGESFPDWIARKTGQIGPCPDAVAQPADPAALKAFLGRAQAQGWHVIPYAGGTSVAGHLQVPGEAPPVLSLDLSALTGLQDLDEHSRLARFGPGTPGPEVEAQLDRHGYRLGHFPQSWEYSTVGGWVATRSSGQQSRAYGRIEQLFAGGLLLGPAGELPIPSIPASSAGPDLRELVLGSEARLGVVARADMRIVPRPEAEAFRALMFPDWRSAEAAARDLAQSRIDLSMVRLSNATETETQLTLAGHEQALGLLQRYVSLRGAGGPEQCLLMLGISGRKVDVKRAWQDAQAICRQHQGVYLGPWIGQAWVKNRFRGPYLRNTLWAAGYGADTIETAVNWPQVSKLMPAMEQAAREALAEDQERVHAFTHLSHVYPQGSSIYSTFVFRACADRERMLERWRRLKRAVSEQIVAHGGTISHQHGVGVDHKPWLAAEKSEQGLDLLRAAAAQMDPQGIMNPGKLFD